MPPEPPVTETTARIPATTIRVPIDDVWQAEYWLVAQPRGLVLAELRVMTKPGVPLPPSGLSARVLRKLRVGDYIDYMDDLLKLARDFPSPGGRAIKAFLAPLIEDDRPSATEASAQRPGRRRLSDEVLLRAASAYDAAVKHHSYRPVLDAAKQIGETPERLRDHLHRARLRGLLSGAISGRAGGTLTPKAKSLLRSQARSTARRRPRR
jgi:hypothetical protein